jgi:hypothetical protein
MKAQAGMQMDWDAVRNINDNGLVQTAKIFDPTGISSYPDVAYAFNDWRAGKGSGANVALNVLGALPIIGKASTVFKLAKLRDATKSVARLKKGIDGISTLTSSINKVTGAPLAYGRSLAGSSNIVAKGTAYAAKGVDKVTRFLGKPLLPVVEGISKKQIPKADYKNLGVDILDTGNFLHDLNAAVSKAVPQKKSLIDKNKKFVFTDPKNVEKAYTNINQ